MKNANVFIDVNLTLIDAKKVVGLYRLAHLFGGFAAKPDFIIDDVPGTALKPFVFEINTESSWPALADKIIHKHIVE